MNPKQLKINDNLSLIVVNLLVKIEVKFKEYLRYNQMDV